ATRLSRVAYVSGKSTSVSSSTIGTSSSSSLSRWTSTEDWRCQEHVRHMRSPNCSYAQRSTCSADNESTSGSRSAGAVAKQHLLQRVAAQAAAERFERDDLVGRDVPEVDRRAEGLDEPGLCGLRGRLEDDVRRSDGHRDLGDQIGAHAAGRVEDPSRAAFASFRDHFPGTGIELLLEPSHPLVRRVFHGRILRADLGEDGEVAREAGDQLELALTRNLDRPVGDLNVREAELCDPRLVLVETVARIDDLEERPADDNELIAENVELPRQ